ncbi:tRNA 2-selenouridine(34) synthase MnmH [Aquabacterium sp.]|uniref:tRNA 2-selenouridine(34) synthase MnmH n=1 Tax=Aquabacterium sp. TaxID=1872578 RepID=UPI002CA9EB05|nr:tRNA 2-selenouridine(34) synthase MnmH [Aquabacterium sp.]HSW04622.1 tRNA 2-selenouridine(34) synthase MnmH [Aquabacterium sp.]
MKAPVRVADRHAFDTLIDARSPAEFALDHIPGAINCPVLDDDERRIVGTLYKQQGAFYARRVGGAMVAANLARHLREQFADKPERWKPLVYCWRGGLRSGSMTQWLRLVGWDAQQLAGGYKSWRRHVIDLIDRVAPQLPLVVICGATGSAKTAVLQALAAQGEQVLDLEGLACHKGSLLGALPDRPQPSQTRFETSIAAVLEGIDLQRPLYVEGESRRIGRLSVPVALIERMRDSACVEIQAGVPARVEYLLRDYAYLGDRPEWLAEQLGQLKELHGKDSVAAWQAQALAHDLPALFEALATRHYDPAYARSQAVHFRRWAGRRVVPAHSLAPAQIAALAAHISRLPAAETQTGTGV